MSSHHIIRDNQEPALILADLDGFPVEKLGHLLEWAPFTICSAGALDQALTYGISLDVVFSDEKPEALFAGKLSHLPHVKVFTHDPDWLKTSVVLLRRMDHEAAHVVQSDETCDVEQWGALQEFLALNWFTPGWRYVWVRQQFRKWLPADTELKVFSDYALEIAGAEFVDNKWKIKEKGLVTIRSQASFVVGMGY